MALVIFSTVNCNYYPGFPIHTPWVHTPQMDPFANQGLAMSAFPQPKTSTFSKDWKTEGYKSMYNLNYMAPYGMDVNGQGMGHSPYVSQLNYNTFPTYLTNGQYNPYGYNLSDPRYHALYQRYYGFFNQDLNMLSKLVKPKNLVDYNNNAGMKDQYGSNFNYHQTFDGAKEADVAPAIITAPGTRSEPRSLKLLHRNHRKRYTSSNIKSKFSYYVKLY
jgi:hypothetical protein